MLRQFYGISIPGMAPLPEDGNGIDLAFDFPYRAPQCYGEEPLGCGKNSPSGSVFFQPVYYVERYSQPFPELMRNKVVKSLLDGQNEMGDPRRYCF